jgi:hypothetical protein
MTAPTLTLETAEEREFWREIVDTVIAEGWDLETAVAWADDSVRAYRERLAPTDDFADRVDAGIQLRKIGDALGLTPAASWDEVAQTAVAAILRASAEERRAPTEPPCRMFGDTGMVTLGRCAKLYPTRCPNGCALTDAAERQREALVDALNIDAAECDGPPSFEDLLEEVGLQLRILRASAAQDRLDALTTAIESIARECMGDGLTNLAAGLRGIIATAKGDG